jgi:hypothetical protein
MPYSPFGLAHLAEDRPHLSAGPLRYWVTDTAGQAIAPGNQTGRYSPR